MRTCITRVDGLLFFFFKQKTAYEMRISDWSSDVCSSDLNDVNAFEAAIRTWRAGGGKGRVWIAFETLYSMEGDMAPIADFAKLAEAEDAWPLMDEAHATGVHGPQGRGLTAANRKSVVEGKSVSVSVGFGGRRVIKK